MDYTLARNLICNGDLIAVRGRTGLLAPFTRYFTRSDYTHVGVAFWMDGGLWLSEINGGHNHAIPLSQLAGVDFDVYQRPDGITGKAVQGAIRAALRERIHYGYLSLPVIGFINFFRIKAFIHARQIVSCAGYSVMTYEMAGWPECTRILSPQDLASMLRFKLGVTGAGKQ